uniref:Uncharacterized protein n=1 Tax=Avena sativa TaxID=4498 RepID=A0ACD5UXF7_AVESA
MATSKALPREPKLLVVSLTSRLDTTEVYSCSLLGPRAGDDLLLTIDRIRRNSLGMVTPSPCYGLTLFFDSATRAYYVCNAATRAITRLPDKGVQGRDITTGLGFDDQTREYKVVRLIKGYNVHGNKQAVMCDVYTAGAHCWRPAAREVPLGLFQFAISAITHASMNKVPPVFANGFLHWLICPNLLACGRPGSAIILFSVADETFGSVPSPPFWGPKEQQRPWHHARDEHLVVMDHQVCIVRYLRHIIAPLSDALEIWGLLDYGSGDWSMNHRIDLCGHIGRKLGYPQSLRVIGSVGNCSSGKKIVIATTNYTFQEKVYTYDPRCQVLRHIHCSAASSNAGPKFSLFDESLAPVHKSDKELALPSTLAKATRETTAPN